MQKVPPTMTPQEVEPDWPDDANARSQMIPEDDLKEAINNMLFSCVPDAMTIRQFELLSCAVFRLVWKARGCK